MLGEPINGILSDMQLGRLGNHLTVLVHLYKAIHPSMVHRGQVNTKLVICFICRIYNKKGGLTQNNPKKTAALTETCSVFSGVVSQHQIVLFTAK